MSERVVERRLAINQNKIPDTHKISIGDLVFF